MRHAAARVALDTGNMTGFDDQLITDTDVWEDIPIDLGMPAQEVHVDPSHEGDEYFHFIDMAQASLSRYFHSFHYKPQLPTHTLPSAEANLIVCANTTQ